MSTKTTASNTKKLPAQFHASSILTGNGRKWFVENMQTHSFIVEGQPDKATAIRLALKRIKPLPTP